MRPKWFQADPKSRYPPAEPVVSRRDLERARKSDNERQGTSRQSRLEVGYVPIVSRQEMAADSTR